MNKRSIIATSTLAVLLVIGGGTAWALNISPTTNNKVVLPQTSSPASITRDVQKSPTPTPSPTASTEPPAVDAPSSTDVNTQANEVGLELPQQEYVPQDMATRQWSDSRGNQYVGPNAISCADGSEPVTIGYGLPAQCAYNSDGANAPILVE